MTREQAHDLWRQMVPFGKFVAACAACFTLGMGYQTLLHRFDRLEQGLESEAMSRRAWAVMLAVYNPSVIVPDPADRDFRPIDAQTLRKRVTP